MNDRQILELTEWVAESGLAGLSETELIDGFCRRLVENGVPLTRMAGIIDTLHPVLEARTFHWHRKKNETQAIKSEPPKAEKKPEPKPKQTQSPNDGKLKGLEKDLKKIEEQIQLLEKQKADAELEMAKPEVFGSPDKIKEAQKLFKKIESDLAEANKKWEDLALKIDELSQN